MSDRAAENQDTNPRDKRGHNSTRSGVRPLTHQSNAGPAFD
jgi:hypothetical protein